MMAILEWAVLFMRQQGLAFTTKTSILFQLSPMSTMPNKLAKPFTYAKEHKELSNVQSFDKIINKSNNFMIIFVLYLFCINNKLYLISCQYNFSFYLSCD
jgi:hypothetical protein